MAVATAEKEVAEALKKARADAVALVEEQEKALAEKTATQ